MFSRNTARLDRTGQRESDGRRPSEHENSIDRKQANKTLQTHTHSTFLKRKDDSRVETIAQRAEPRDLAEDYS